MHGKLALAFENEFSHLNSLSLGPRQALHVSEAVISAKLLLVWCLVDQIASHLLLFILQLLFIVIIILVTLVGVVRGRLLFG